MLSYDLEGMQHAGLSFNKSLVGDCSCAAPVRKQFRKIYSEFDWHHSYKIMKVYFSFFSLLPNNHACCITLRGFIITVYLLDLLQVDLTS